MKRFSLRDAVVAALMLAILTSSSNAQNVQIKEPVPTTPQDLRAKKILGSAVHIQGDISIGTVDDIVFRDDGVVEYLVVINDGKLITVPWEAAKFNFEKRTATLSITREQHRLIPTFTLETYPRFFTPEFQIQTYKYYGLTPAQERRLDRLERKR